MQSEKPCCPAAAARMVKKLALPSGEVGVVNLERIFKEVADLKLTDDEIIKMELLNMVKVYNYVAPPTEADYSEALLKAFNRQYRIQIGR